MEKIKKFLIKREVEMKKIILSLILIGFLRAFIDMPEGWRQRKTIKNINISGAPGKGVEFYSKGDTLVAIFLEPDTSGNLQNYVKLRVLLSYNCGFSWSSPVSAHQGVIDEGVIACPEIVIDDSFRIFVAYAISSTSPPNWYKIKIKVSEDLGRTWEIRYEDGDSLFPVSPFLCMAQKGNKVGLTYLKKIETGEYRIHFTFTQNGGQSWLFPPEILELEGEPRLVIDAGGNFYALGILFLETLARREGINQWTYYVFPDSLYTLRPNRIMRADPSTPHVIHFVYTDWASYTCYRKFIENQFTPRVEIIHQTEIQHSDFVVDPNNKIYLVLGQSRSPWSYLLRYFISYDGGNTWKDRGFLSSARFWYYEKTKRGRGLGIVDISGEEWYGRPQFQGNDDYSISNQYLATAYNHNKHLARIPNTEDLYAVFSMQTDSQDVVAVRSLDGGVNWENYKVIGHGVAGTPCIWIDPSLPDIVTYLWIHPQIDTILQYRTYTISTGSWSSIYNLRLPSTYKVDLSSPSISMCRTRRKIVVPKDFLIVTLKATGPADPCLLVIQYDITNPATPVENHWVISSSGTTPSISYSYTSSFKYHCVYEENGKIYYREKLYGNSYSWTPPFPISHENVDAYNPSIEVYGDSLYVVWSEDEGTGKHEVFRRRKKVTEPYNYWPSDPEPVSENSQNYDSRYPTNSELKFTLWNEEDHNNTGEYDPWFRYNDDPPMVFYNTAEHSYFPHGNRYLTSFHIWLYGIWTEKDHLLYRIMSHKRLYGPIGESSYLSYSGGENSPYLIEREGIKDYGNIRVDIGQNLIYEFHLDTIYSYEVEAEFYFEGNGIRKGKIITSNFDLPFEYKGNEIKKIRFQVKKENLFEDKLYLRIKNIAGPEVSLKALNVYRYEKEEETPGGGQGSKISGIRNSILKVYPNFVKDKFILSYTVNSFSPLEISLYDILGRKVYTFIKEKIVAPGNYKIELRKPDNLKSGIYFLRMETQDEKGIEKIILH
uniref:T9SS type A sorting domain-containing protein n=2 Tax=candidate division WOR-3 bacterium TaxID=2052148 RepID=A0A7V3ZTT3_UNCW3